MSWQELIVSVMKTKKKIAWFILFTSLIMLTVLESQGQDWNTGGNGISGSEYFGATSGSTIPIQFVHNANIGGNSRFEWHTNLSGTVTERMRLTQAGWLGLGTTSPLAHFHQRNGDFLVDSDLSVYYPFTGTPSIPISGSGLRLMWVETLGAFRVGGVSGDYWDLTEVGPFSFAAGYDCKAFGGTSVAMGLRCRALDEGAVAMGDSCTASGHDSFAAGEFSVASGGRSVALGQNNLSSGFGSFTGGTQNTASGNYAAALGNSCVASGDFSFSAGGANQTLGSGSFSLGRLNLVESDFAGALGKLNAVADTGSIAMGCFINSTGKFNITLGIGDISSLDELSNPIDSCLMVGFNSDVSTLFVGPSLGSGTFGNVGIGNITAPTERIDVNGNGRFRSIPDNEDDVLITGTLNGTGDYTLSRIGFGNTPTNPGLRFQE